MRPKLFRGLYAEHWRGLLVQLGYPPLGAEALAAFLVGDNALPPAMKDLDGERFAAIASYTLPKEKQQ